MFCRTGLRRFDYIVGAPIFPARVPSRCPPVQRNHRESLQDKRRANRIFLVLCSGRGPEDTTRRQLFLTHPLSPIFCWHNARRDARGTVVGEGDGKWAVCVFHSCLRSSFFVCAGSASRSVAMRKVCGGNRLFVERAKIKDRSFLSALRVPSAPNHVAVGSAGPQGLNSKTSSDAPKSLKDHSNRKPQCRFRQRWVRSDTWAASPKCIPIIELRRVGRDEGKSMALGRVRGLSTKAC